MTAGLISPCGDESSSAYQLVELEVVHVAPSRAQGVQHDQHVVAVAVHLRHTIALDAVPIARG